jgi:hypothetical protein
MSSFAFQKKNLAFAGTIHWLSIEPREYIPGMNCMTTDDSLFDRGRKTYGNISASLFNNYRCSVLIYM